MRLALSAICLACLPAAQGAFGASDEALTTMDFPAERIDDNHATPEIVLESDSISPGGTVWIGVRFKIEGGWHLYWNGRNDSGNPPTFSVELPQGYTLGEWLWPAPKRHVAPGDILDHIYEGSVVLMAPLKAPPATKDSATDGTKVTIKIAADWLVCDSNMCVAESGSIETTVPVKSAAKESKDAAAFVAARATHPKPWPTASKDFTTSVVTKDTKTTATIRVAGATSIEFYPTTDCPEVDGLLKTGTSKGETLLVTVLAHGEQHQADITGVVAVGRNGQQVSEFYTVRLALPKASK